MIYKNTKYNKGYTLLFAVLVSSLVLSVGISILTVSKKEFLLASSARESTTAFYAADTGLECAAYYDFTSSKFATSSIGGVGDNVYCAGHTARLDKKYDPTTDPPNPLEYSYIFTFHTSINPGTRECAIVTVKKNKVGDTDMESRGYNTGWIPASGSSIVDGNTCTGVSPKRVERALRYSYKLQ